MDYKKDIRERGLMSQRNATSIEAFSITLSKKCERLATAIYLVTNFLSDTEPLKSRLRTLSIDFVRDASAMKRGGSTVEVNVFDALRANIGETLSLLELAFIAGLVSEMNFTVLKREYVSLRDSIDIKKASRESHTDTVLGDTFFGSSFHPEEDARMPVVTKAEPTLTENKMSFTVSDSKMKKESTQDIKATSKTSAEREVTVSNRAVTDVAKEGRRARILKLVKDNREVAIKDIVEHFPDLSEKTIQRELVAMSDSGVLKKFGERRWSRYTLA